jgi:hypothetical protein
MASRHWARWMPAQIQEPGQANVDLVIVLADESRFAGDPIADG